MGRGSSQSGQFMNHVEIVVGLSDGRQPAVEQLVDLAASVDDHSPLGEHKYLRLRRGDDHTLGILAWGEAGGLAGYAHALLFDEEGERRLAFELVVHPDHRNSGVARQLISRIVGLGERIGVDAIDAWAYGDSAAASRLAAELDFALHRTLLHLSASTEGRTWPPLPAGLRYSRFRPESDADSWLALNRRVFDGHPEQGRWTADDLAARMREPWFDPNDFLVVRSGEEIVAFNWLKCRIEAAHPDAEIYVLGVAPEWAGHGLGSALIEAGLAHLLERGLDHGCVYVDEDNRGAVRRYLAAGFVLKHRDICYRRTMQAAAASPATSVREALRDLATG